MEKCSEELSNIFAENKCSKFNKTTHKHTWIKGHKMTNREVLNDKNNAGY